MFQDAEICKMLIKESPENYIEANILYFRDFTFKFEPLKHRIGVLKSLVDQNNHEVNFDDYARK
jgi:hypothetical protein